MNELGLATKDNNSSGMKNIVHAVIIAEDHRFCGHNGIDWRSVIRATSKTLFNGQLQGASTIEQQLVRTIRGRYEVTLGRKISEMLLALEVSKQYKKTTIIRNYIEIAYFGWRAAGLAKAAARLNIYIPTADKIQSASLSALLKLPMPKSPSEAYIDRYQARVAHILSKWDKIGDCDG